DGLYGRALALGAKAGTSAGAIAGAALACVCYRRGIVVPWRRIVAHVFVPVGWAIAGGAIAGLVASLWPPSMLRDAIAEYVPAVDRDGFVVVWCTHLGLYVGAVTGLAVAVIRGVRGGREICSMLDGSHERQEAS
ncbi:MAG: hypothetical protein KDB80_00405, partial [Planctomycetes bacterium]|nr:hypothetical protein [Planctomycetota bacterium]